MQQICVKFSVCKPICAWLQNVYKFATEFATEKVVSKSICKLKANYNNTKIIHAYGRKLLMRVVKGGSQSHFPPEIFPKSQSQLDFY